ncbi:MAG: DUF1254 domain-containing protein [Gemmobacter sp.]
MALKSATVAALLALSASTALADPKPVNAVTFIRAESDRYMANMVTAQGLGKMVHERTTTPLDKQSIIRMNLDTLYSSGVYDLAAGPVTVTMPPADPKRYVAMQIVSQDHLTPKVLHEGTHTITQEEVGTRYVALLVRVFLNSSDPGDLARVHAVQDSIKVEQAAAGTYEAVDWDKTSLDAARNALLSLGALGDAGFGIPMGTKDEIDPIAHLVATAAGWGLNPPTEAVYKMVTPAQNDGKTPHQVVMKDMPVDAFWSVSVYDKDGFFAPNSLNVNALNSVSAKAAADGSQTIRFGGCDAGVENCIPITEGWNYTLRLYRPHPEVIDGSWTAPVAEPVK